MSPPFKLPYKKPRLWRGIYILENYLIWEEYLGKISNASDISLVLIENAKVSYFGQQMSIV
ncbi:MAG TPA: hypothetical protein DEF34_08075 [Desulfotomaculum sp.]|nr:MAG: hypothetical protein JL56_07200 [Desulfotomaculum sp. BICA1-6]HBX23570.1 hypothetical protein [Desulfotomaculum sp.]